MFWKIYSIISCDHSNESSLFHKFNLTLDNAFVQSQKTYWTLKRFARRLKKYVTYSANEDLYGSPLIPKYTIELIQDDCIYKFSVHDLVNIIKSALLTVVHGYPNPKYPRNPYTNKDFNIYHLLSIYVFMWAYTPRLVYNNVIRGFYKANFNLNTFKNENIKLLAIQCVESMVPKTVAVTAEIEHDILHMLLRYSSPYAKIYISKLINKNILYQIFRPYLRLYYQHRLLNANSKILKNALLGFSLYNLSFGRNYYDFEKKQIYVDMRHLGFRDSLYVYKVLAKQESNVLKPIENVFYYPLHRYNLTRTILTRVDRNEIFTLPTDMESG